MKYALNLAEDKRILRADFAEYASADAVPVDYLPDGDIADYRYIDEKYVYDPLPKPERPEPAPSYDDRIKALEEENAELREALDLILSGVTE